MKQRESFRNFAFALLLVLHGYAHAALGMTAQDKPHVARFGLGASASLYIATVLFAYATTGFVTAGFAIWGLRGLFDQVRLLIKVAAVSSVVLVVLYAKSLTEAAAPLLLDVGLYAFAQNSSLSKPVFARDKAEGRLQSLAWRSTQLKGLVLIPYMFVLIVTRPWYRTWGASNAERKEALAGDEHAGDPARAGDRAIAIDAPAQNVWPWVLQLGEDRGGFYSYTSLENLFGLHIVNAERIEPSWQHLEPGDFIRAVPDRWMGGIFGSRIGWEVDHVDHVRHVLALRYWVFHVETTGETTSVLHVRTHAGAPPVPIAPLILATFEPMHFVMERAMLIGIKERAERPQVSGSNDDGEHSVSTRGR